MNQGFSIGIDDVTPSLALLEAKEKLLKEGYDRCTEHIREWKEGKLELHPGCTAEQTVEVLINSKLSNIREDAGKVCIKVSGSF